MKRMISAASNSSAKKVADTIEFLVSEGVPRGDILDFFVSELTSDQSMKILKELAKMTDVDLNEMN